jgi:hypothetical protein
MARAKRKRYAVVDMLRDIGTGHTNSIYPVVVELPGVTTGKRPMMTISGVRRDTTNGRLVIELDEAVEEAGV